MVHMTLDIMDPRSERIIVPDDDVRQLLEWSDELEKMIIATIFTHGSAEAIDRVLNLKRIFLKSVPIHLLEEYLSFNNPTPLPLDPIYKLIDEAYAVQI